MLTRVALGLALALLSTGCASAWSSQPGSEANRWRTIKVTNQYPTSVVLYPSLSGTTLWQRIDRVPAHSEREVQVPAAYFRRDFQIVVCSSSGALGDAACTRTNRYLGQLPVPEIVVFPTPAIHAEIFGD